MAAPAWLVGVAWSMGVACLGAGREWAGGVGCAGHSLRGILTLNVRGAMFPSHYAPHTIPLSPPSVLTPPPPLSHLPFHHTAF